MRSQAAAPAPANGRCGSETDLVLRRVRRLLYPRKRTLSEPTTFIRFVPRIDIRCGGENLPIIGGYERLAGRSNYQWPEVMRPVPFQLRD